MTSKRLLLIEDEDNLREILRFNLELEGFELILARDGSEGMRKASELEFDIVILDVMLPFISGMEICKKIKSLHPEIPVLMISAKGQSSDRISGLRSGADDYLPKPFDLEELILRIENLMKRAGHTPINIHSLSFDDYTIDFQGHKILKSGQEIHQLSRKEAGLLELLTRKSGETVSREQIINQLWDDTEIVTSRTIDNHIVTFRKIFNDDSRNPKYFLSIRGIGYQFKGKTIS